MKTFTTSEKLQILLKAQDTNDIPSLNYPLTVEKLTGLQQTLTETINQIDGVIYSENPGLLTSKAYLPDSNITYFQFYEQLSDIRYKLSKRNSRVLAEIIKMKRETYHYYNQKAINAGGIYLDAKPLHANSTNHKKITGLRGITL